MPLLKTLIPLLTLSLPFDHFIRFFQDRVFVDVLLRSLIIAFFTTVLCIIIGYPCAYFILNQVMITKNCDSF